MAVLNLQIPDERIVQWTAAAEKRGLTLADWLLETSEKAAQAEIGPPRRLTLEERLALCDPEAPISEDERFWMADPPVGEELI
ncbi:hypothetical protein F183_A05940 [Bryobacterales bacterium F-183]|nr:hypothetical protein F183_A05940 [Bryobacterales bacterium F-183]